MKLDNTEFTVFSGTVTQGDVTWKAAAPSVSIEEAISILHQVSNSVCHPAESTADPERVLVWGAGRGGESQILTN